MLPAGLLDTLVNSAPATAVIGEGMSQIIFAIQGQSKRFSDAQGLSERGAGMQLFHPTSYLQIFGEHL